jgi:hypothetical protein
MVMRTRSDGRLWTLAFTLGLAMLLGVGCGGTTGDLGDLQESMEETDPFDPEGLPEEPPVDEEWAACEEALGECLVGIEPEDDEGVVACHVAFDECMGIEPGEVQTCEEMEAECLETCPEEFGDECAVMCDVCIDEDELPNTECEDAFAECVADLDPEDWEAVVACDEAFVECLGIEPGEELTCEEMEAECLETCPEDLGDECAALCADICPPEIDTACDDAFGECLEGADPDDIENLDACHLAYEECING